MTSSPDDPTSLLLTPVEGFLRALAARPDHTALEVGAATWSYRDLAAAAGAIAAEIRAAESALGGVGRVAVLASRSMTAYAGSLAVFGAGVAHVALSPSHPTARCADILRQAESVTLVVGPEALETLPALLALAPEVRAVIAPESADLSELREARPDLRLCGAGDLTPTPLRAPRVAWSDLAYLVFTSGSTGAPKGVAIQHDNLATYMHNFRAQTDAAPLADDRVATTYELTFDIALHDMLQTWWSGATLCVVPARQLTAPARFIRAARITHWFSVASAGMLMERQGTLRPGAFPLLRVTMLCGEPLPVGTAAAWAEAAPASILYNVYGPTETTMELAFYRWDPQTSPAQCRRGIVPIGVPFRDHRHLLRDEEGREITGPGQGELLLCGPQVGPGYWRLPTQTAHAFIRLPGRSGVWYRTGDRVERDEDGLYHFVSRLDHMVKLRGHRIELGEIEAALRAVAGTNLVAVLPFPLVGGNAQGLVAFASGNNLPSPEALRLALSERIPLAWVPDQIEIVEEMPLNSNRKIDRAALLQHLLTATPQSLLPDPEPPSPGTSGQ